MGLLGRLHASAAPHAVLLTLPALACRRQDGGAEDAGPAGPHGQSGPLPPRATSGLQHAGANPTTAAETCSSKPPSNVSRIACHVPCNRLARDKLPNLRHAERLLNLTAALQEPRLAWFDAVLADIGDAQDLRASLSTFSGHVRRLAGILATATDSSLVVLDEVCIGCCCVDSQLCVRTLSGLGRQWSKPSCLGRMQRMEGICTLFVGGA